MSDEIEESRARHEAGPRGQIPLMGYAVAHADRATLLDEVDRLRAEIERVTRYVGLVLEKRIQFSEALTSIAQNTCCDGCQEAAKVARKALEGKP